MAYNFIGLVNDVNRRLNEVELTSANFNSAIGFYAQAKDAVNSSIRDINQQYFEWPFNHVKEEQVLTAGTVRYGYPADVKSIDFDSFRIKQDDSLGNDTRKLKVISYEEYLDKFVDAEYETNSSARAFPSHVFRAPNREWGLVPSPDKAYTVAYEYYKVPDELVASTDVPTIPSQFRHLIIDGAMYHSYLFRGDINSAQLSLQKFNQNLDNMRSIYINRYEYVRSTVIDRNQNTSGFI
jgi:hypothetical protein